MTERVQKLMEEALSRGERAELLAALMATTKRDEEAMEEFELRWNGIGAESLGYIA